MNYRLVLFVLVLTFSSNLVAQKKWYSVEEACTKQGHALMGRRDIANYVDQYMPDSVVNTPDGRPVPNEDSLVAVAEPFLFKTYGQQLIESERPYEAYSVDGYWVLSGTMQADVNSKGGTFTIIVNSKNGAIVNYWHDK